VYSLSRIERVAGPLYSGEPVTGVLEAEELVPSTGPRYGVLPAPSYIVLFRVQMTLLLTAG